ncbi:MAG TPA: Tad domain-containing protein [Abditibacteriaceae bacterium]
MTKLPLYSSIFPSRPAQLQRHTPRRGTVMHVVAGSMVMLCGCAALAVDYGILISDKNQLQRACDAAALGGATHLPNTTDAQNKAALVAGLNRVPDDDTNDLTYTFLENNSRIRVTALRRRSLFFARVFGQQSGLVRASAMATLRSNSTPLISPIGIDTTTANTFAPGGLPLPGTLNRTTLTLIEHKKSPFALNSMILFDMRSVDTNAKSPTKMREQLDGTVDPPIEVTPAVPPAAPTDFLDALNANIGPQTNNFLDAMRTRFQAAAGAPWFDTDPLRPADYIDYVGQNYDKVLSGSEPSNGPAPFYRNPRILGLIVTNPAPIPSGGNMNTPVLDFAPVYVENITQTADKTDMTVRFLPRNSGLLGGQAVLLE